MLSVLKSILDVGISFTPTGDFLKAAKAAVQGAKTFSENGLEVGSFFGNWVGPACGKQDWNFDVFGALLNMPDSMGTSTGCHKKVKADCKKPQHKPDPSKPAKPTEKVSATPAEKTTHAPENPCWPKDLVPDDPGWVLNTADEFYSQGQHPDLAKHTKSYRGLPDLQVLKNALAKHGGSPPHPFSKVDLNVWDTKKRIKMGDKEGEIPKEYRGVLPGNPKPKKRRMLFEENRRDNGTDFEQDNEPLDEDEDEGAFDEWESWKEYERLLRRAHFELASRTTPQRTEAEATPAGQGDATPTPATQGSAVANEWPLPTN
ncbi:hypothetical protein K4K49_011400 [Colletotrichum sp. SAR 10_70]|nr:hypothetical protein K4K49_011400 [Colletotrichum sp. SAR 10_70]KAI8171479.1 hypothetical protein KHU50_005478 [Colletotrichum sp. SAR 10_65]